MSPVGVMVWVYADVLVCVVVITRHRIFTSEHYVAVIQQLIANFDLQTS